jgi:TM2 domain-containing membrane protein YozV
VTEADDLRIGTAERESAVKILSEHMSEGRLSLEEYEERMALALEARTQADLKPLFTDLPAPHPWFMQPPSAPVPALPPPSGPPVPYVTAPPPMAGMSDKNQLAAGILQILLPFGIGRFYTGHTGIGLAQLLTAPLFIGVVWSWIDGILFLVNGGTDAQGRPLQSG